MESQDIYHAWLQGSSAFQILPKLQIVGILIFIRPEGWRLTDYSLHSLENQLYGSRTAVFPAFLYCDTVKYESLDVPWEN